MALISGHVSADALGRIDIGLVYNALQPLNRVPVVGRVGRGGVCKVIFVSNPTPVEVDLRLC